MASLFKKTMLYLGLGPDEDYEVYDEEPERERVERDRGGRSERGDRREGREPPAPARGAAPRSWSSQDQASAVRPIRPGHQAGAATQDQAPPAEERPASRGGAGNHSASGASSVVRPLPRLSNAKPHTLAPSSFNDVQEVADRFKASQPVIVNLEGADRDLRRRLIDFCSGLCYGLTGQMERVADNVYLLTPSNVEVSAEDRRRLERELDD